MIKNILVALAVVIVSALALGIAFGATAPLSRDIKDKPPTEVKVIIIPAEQYLAWMRDYARCVKAETERTGK